MNGPDVRGGRGGRGHRGRGNGNNGGARGRGVGGQGTRRGDGRGGVQTRGGQAQRRGNGRQNNDGNYREQNQNDSANVNDNPHDERGGRGGGRGRGHGHVDEEPSVRPTFGFKKLNGFLSASPEEVIFSISRANREWENYLKSENIKSTFKNNNLHLVVQVLAKITQELPLLANQQIPILLAAINDPFLESVTEQCRNIMFPSDKVRSNRYNAGEFVEVDKSAQTFLASLLTFAKFMLKRMEETSMDFIQKVMGHAFAAICTRASSDPSFIALKTDYENFIGEMNMISKQRLEKQRIRSNATQRNRDKFTEDEEKELDEIEVPNDFRDIPIVPTLKELLATEDAFLRPNKKSGAYNDFEHYLDVQFRLLREDFVQPLKKGIQDFMRHSYDYLNKKKRIPIGTIRIYPEVAIIGAELAWSNTVYKVQLPESSYKKIKWEKSKRLLTGSLLVFTPRSDLFKSECYFAVLASRKVEELKKGIVSITWESDAPIWDRDIEYLMVECEVYFEAYRHTLQSLKKLELDKFPMSKYIVDAFSDPGPPKYLEDSTDFLKLELKTGETKYFYPLTHSQWPRGVDLGLDSHQFTSFQAALTKEFCCIQGPPGTGKTFIGLKVAETFLTNEDIYGSVGPILVVCYTNHALDQFLEGILEIFTSSLKNKGNAPIVRVGGRSKCEALEPYTLGNVFRKKRIALPQQYYDLRRDTKYNIDRGRYQRSSLIDTIMALKDLQGIINFEELAVWSQLAIEFPTALWKCFQTPSWLGLNDANFQHHSFNEINLLLEWFEILEIPRKVKNVFHPQQSKNVENPKIENGGVDIDEEDDDEDYDIEELLQDRILDDIYAEVESKGPSSTGRYLPYISGQCLKDINKCITKARASQGSQNISQDQYAKLEKELKVMRNKREFLLTLFDHYSIGRIELPDVTNVLQRIRESPAPEIILNQRTMPMSERWALYFAITDRARVLTAEKASKQDKELITLQNKLQDIQKYADVCVLKQSKVVGLTTTGASKYSDLLKNMGSKIVIVEEAAEVLESHIVTCITKSTEHVILIGDHRQLRPSTTVFELQLKYNMDISLFERMINNNLNCYQLKVQHRMRPEIANLVVGTVYEELQNFENVYSYPNVKGLTKNLFFLSHNELEKSESDSMSKSNTFEAKFLAGLCRYLILQGYEPSQITILTTYTGQMFLLKKSIDFLSCRGLRVTCVDNYQGEENDIILLSLVRSNVESKIGFLNISNRICVALSRAKHGLFIVGNMNLLSMKSKTWDAIKEKLEYRGEIGIGITLECQNHGTKATVQNASEINTNSPEGGCLVICNDLLECGHNCEKVCHIKDKEHKNYKCMKPCPKTCKNNHPCTAECFKLCPGCTTIVKKSLPCSHEKNMYCYTDPNKIICEELVNKKMPCGHTEILPCHIDPAKYTCKIRMNRVLSCGHSKDLECHIDPASILCKIIVEKTLPCNHQQLAECRFLPEMVGCETVVEKLIVECKHKVKVKCKDKNKAAIRCTHHCPIRLSCGHQCTKICHVLEDPKHLNYVCRKDCARKCSDPEAHDCSVKHKCNTPCPPCTNEVFRTLSCGHITAMPCSVDVTQYECLELCERILPNCLHKCEKLCFEACQPCHAICEKRVPECGHIISVECATNPTNDLCKELVRPDKMPLCRHHVKVPCCIRKTATSKEIMALCQHPCAQSFSNQGGCDHHCLGSCGSCSQGRLHVKCQERCGKQKVCGHSCDFPCSSLCPPCDKKCLMKCEHSECSNPCGTPCHDCAEPCPWRCPHKSCSMLCRQICDREPCNEPCPEILPCNHPCIGFCGEPCPPHCRICNRAELTEFILYGNEEDEDARFIFLPDCGHSIEAEGLTYHMNLDNAEIGMKCCPRCRTVIKYNRRFGSVIKRRLENVIKVKTKAFGNKEKIIKTQTEVIQKLQWDPKWSRNFQSLHDFLLDLVVEVIPAKRGDMKNVRKIPKKVDEWTMSSINVLVGWAENAVDILSKAKDEAGGLKDDLQKHLHNKYRKLFSNITERKLPLSQVEVRDANREFDRLFDLYQIYRWRSNPKFTDGHSRAIPIYRKLLEIVRTPEPYLVETHRQQIHTLLKSLEDVLRTGLGITQDEKRQILVAIGLGKGHWYSCPNGHIYAIGDCGGANQESTCNECGARIGGQSHRVTTGNRLATEMDGATVPAWPTGLD